MHLPRPWQCPQKNPVALLEHPGLGDDLPRRLRRRSLRLRCPRCILRRALPQVDCRSSCHSMTTGTTGLSELWQLCLWRLHLQVAAAEGGLREGDLSKPPDFPGCHPPLQLAFGQETELRKLHTLWHLDEIIPQMVRAKLSLASCCAKLDKKVRMLQDPCIPRIYPTCTLEDP